MPCECHYFPPAVNFLENPATIHFSVIGIGFKISITKRGYGQTSMKLLPLRKRYIIIVIIVIIIVRTSSSNLLLYWRMLKGLSFITCKVVVRAGGVRWPFCWGVIFKILKLVLGGHIQITDHYLGDHFDKFHESRSKQ